MAASENLTIDSGAPPPAVFPHNAKTPQATASSPAPPSPSSNGSAISGAKAFQTDGRQNALVDESLEKGFDGPEADSPAITRWIDRLKSIWPTRSHVSKKPPDVVPNKTPAVHEYVRGYPRAAAIMDTDPSFLLFRKFGWLRNCLLLDMQEELHGLEAKLTAHDNNEKNDARLISRRDDCRLPKSRKDLLLTIKQKLDEYDDFLLRTQNIQAMKRPSPKYRQSVFNFINEDNNILASEMKWLHRPEDLASISLNAEHNRLNGWVEDLLNKFSAPFVRWAFRNKELKGRTGEQPRLDLVSPHRMSALIGTILTVVLSLEVLVPLLVLNKLETNDPVRAQRVAYSQIGFIVFCTLVFSGSCSVLTAARRQEIFTATAGYCAVLVVFLSNSSTT